MYIENSILKKYVTYWLAAMFWFVSIMIIVGGLTRLTDSGLSITEWKLFSGFLPPIEQCPGCGGRKRRRSPPSRAHPPLFSRPKLAIPS